MIETAEAVGIGHPDKMADLIAQTVADTIIRKGCASSTHTAIECALSDKTIFVFGEATKGSWGDLDVLEAVTGALEESGVRWNHVGKHWVLDKDTRHVGPQMYNARLVVEIAEQSPYINGLVTGVDGNLLDDEFGAGDQGIVTGYYTNKALYGLPIATGLAQQLARSLNFFALQDDRVGTDCKTQVTVDDNKLVEVSVAVVTDGTVDMQEIVNQLEPIVTSYVDQTAKQCGTVIDVSEYAGIKINKAETWLFPYSGPNADSGLTGRKLAIPYGPTIPIGGGAYLCGKDLTKVDFSGALMAREAAKWLVENGYANEALVQLDYIIGSPRPRHVYVSGDLTVNQEKAAQLLLDRFSFSIRECIRRWGNKNFAKLVNNPWIAEELEYSLF